MRHRLLLNGRFNLLRGSLVDCGGIWCCYRKACEAVRLHHQRLDSDSCDSSVLPNEAIIHRNLPQRLFAGTRQCFTTVKPTQRTNHLPNTPTVPSQALTLVKKSYYCKHDVALDDALHKVIGRAHRRNPLPHMCRIKNICIASKSRLATGHTLTSPNLVRHVIPMHEAAGVHPVL